MYRHISSLRNNPSGFLNPGKTRIGITRRGENVCIPDGMLDSHTLITGSTGMGKSNLLKLLGNAVSMMDDSAVLIIDPHGDFAMNLMSTFPEKVLFLSSGKENIDGVEHAIFMNPMHTPGLDSHVTAGLIRDVFSENQTLSQGTWGPRLELVFTSLLSKLLESDRNASLSDFVEILTNQRKLRNILRDSGEDSFSQYMKMQMSDWKGWLAFVSSTLNKVIPVTSNPLISSLTSGREDSFSLEDVFRNRMIVIPEIWNSVLSGEASTVLSSLIIVKLWGYLLSRYGKEKTRLRVFIDEAQLIPESLIEKIMTEGRKFGFSLTLATQQIPGNSETWKRSVLGNCASVFMFGTSDRDSSLISGSYFSDATEKSVKETVKGLLRGECVAWSKNGGSISGPISFKTMPVPDVQFDSAALRRETFRRYGIPLKERENSETVDLHEELISRFSFFMERKGIRLDTGISVAGKVPDGIFQTGGNQIILEVEVSDLMNPRRTWEKILHYKGWKKVLLTPENFGEQLMEKMVDRIMGISAMEREQISHSLSSFLETAVAEFDQRFRLVIPGGRMLLNMENIMDGSLLTAVRRNRYGPILEKALHAMVKNGSCRAEILEIFSSSMNHSIMGIFREKYCKDSDYITLKEVYEICRI